MTGRRVARVLLDSPLPQLDRLLDYAVPDALADAVRPGIRIKAPLRSGRRIVEGWVIELADADDADRALSELDAVVGPVPTLPPPLFDLARRVADRAAGSASDILRLAVPRRMVRAEKAWLSAEPPAPPVIAAEDLAWAEQTLAAFPGLADALAAGERVALSAPPRVDIAGTTAADGHDVGAWTSLLAAAATTTLARGASVVLVVPDHRDLAELLRVLRGCIPADALVVNDPALGAQERYAGYLRVLADQPSVVVGSRSTVYAPASRTGLVAIWDDGDPLLAEPLSPYVHARDAALVRQEQEHSALLIAGHTRTTEVERLVSLGWMREVRASRPVSPRVVLSATREGESRGARIPSAAFAAARDALASGPVLVQVARPGWAPVLVCDDCRRPARCVHCSGPLGAARAGATPVCGWCGRSATGWVCPHCEGTRFRFASSGSERTADDLGRAFPGIRVVVADGEHPVDRVDARPALVIATRGAEPIADGGYRAIVLLDGERMLLADDLRIGEAALRWWSNAAALAAPGAPVHLVSVAGPVARALATWTQPAYARAELAGRGELRMPPAVRVALVEGYPDAVERALARLHAEVPDLAEGSVVGPVRTDDDSRALVRIDYAHGAAVAASLRAETIAAALRRRRGGRPGGRAPLRVRFDLPDPVL